MPADIGNRLPNGGQQLVGYRLRNHGINGTVEGDADGETEHWIQRTHQGKDVRPDSGVLLSGPELIDAGSDLANAGTDISINKMNKNL